MQKKKNTTSKKASASPIKSRLGKKVPGTNIVLTGTAHGEDPKLVVRPCEVPDLEMVAEEPDDDLSRHKFPPPKKNPKFRELWGQFIDSVMRRQNFHVAHLNSLKILCDLLVEYEDLHKFIRVNGRSYQSIGRSGTVWRFYPEVGQLKSVQHQINVYMKQLGLVLKPDTSGLSDGEDEAWD